LRRISVPDAHVVEHHQRPIATLNGLSPVRLLERGNLAARDRARRLRSSVTGTRTLRTWS
jgi:hypothetical protein